MTAEGVPADGGDILLYSDGLIRAERHFSCHKLHTVLYNCPEFVWNDPGICKDGYTLVTLPRIVTPYRDSVDRTRARVTYQKLVTRWRYWLFRCAVGIWPSHQRDDMVMASAGLDVQRCCVTRSRALSTLSRYGVTIRGNVTSVDPPLTITYSLEMC